MAADKTNCTVCNAEILVTTASRTGGKCMPCVNGDRYSYVAYLAVEDFFARTSDDYALAPNLEPHPPNPEFKTALTTLRAQPGVAEVLIPVDEFGEPEQELEPCSDRIFIIGAPDETTIADWANRLGAEFYREERAGAEVPLNHSRGQPAWCLVWD